MTGVQSRTNKKTCKLRVLRLTGLYACFIIFLVLIVEVLLPATFPVVDASVFSDPFKAILYAIFSTLAVGFLVQMECKKHPSDKILKEIYKNNKLHIYLLDLDGKIVYANKSVYSSADQEVLVNLVGSLFYECPLWAHDDEIKSRLRGEVYQALSGKSAQGLWEQGGIGSAAKHHIAYSITGVHDEYGHIQQLLVEGRDVTELRALEEQLAKTNQQQEVMLNSLPMAFYSYQPHEEIKKLWVSDQIIKVTGFTPEHLYENTKRWGERIHPDDYESVMSQKKNIKENGSYSLEYKWRDGDDEYRWLRDVAVYVKDGSLNEPEVVGVCIDITEEREAFQNLQLMEDFQLNNSIPLLCFEDGKCMFSNTAARELFGYSEQELLSSRAEVIQPDEQKWRDRLAKLRVQEKHYEEWELVKKDGDVFPAMVSATLTMLGGKEYLYFSTRDISTRKEMEKDLIQTQKLEALGTLAGGLAHDYNNILSAIFGYTQLARMNVGDTEKQEHALTGIYNATSRAKELVQQILTFSRKSRNEKNVMQLSVLSKEVMKFLRQSIPSTIEIRSDVVSDSLVLMNPTQIHQMYVNFCTNASQAMRVKGGILNSRLFDIEFTQAEGDGDTLIPQGKYVCIEITDNGIGMDEKTLQKIFDPYFSTQQKAEGRGLGLAVVHGIISDHNGYIRVESSVDVGTTFRVYFPIVEREREESLTSSELTNLRGHEHILFVDDEPAIVNVTSRVLQRNGYRVTTCLNGEEGWNCYIDNPESFDMVVTDLTMPKMTGAELSTKILEEDPEFPIFVCSGNQDQFSDDMFEDLGVRAFIEKPYHMKQLIAEIRKCLDEAS